MMFDNTPQSAPSPLATAKAHLPLMVLVGAAVTLFIGLHTAATAVVVVAGGHGAVVLIALASRWMYRRRNEATA